MSSASSSSSSIAARGRLAVLAAHLAAAASLESSPISLEAECVSAQVPPPGNLQGSLTIVDDRTGKKYRIPVSQHSTVKASDFKKVKEKKKAKSFFVFCILMVHF